MKPETSNLSGTQRHLVVGGCQGNPKREQPYASIVIGIVIVAIILTGFLLALGVIHADKVLS